MRISTILRLSASVSCFASAFCYFVSLFYSPKSQTTTAWLIAGSVSILITALSSFAAHLSELASASGARTEMQTRRQGKDVSGIGGWLLLLCIGLTIIGPIGSVFGIAGKLIIGDFLSAVLFFLEGIFSMYVGYRLWTIKSEAVAIVKTYLWIILMINSTIPFTVAIFRTLEWVSPEVMVRASLSSISFAIWFSYLMFSKRVANTYAADAAITLAKASNT